MKKLKLIALLVNLFVLSSSLTVVAQSGNNKSARELLEQANNNIEKYRKGDISITITNKKGKTVPGVQVRIEQKTHAFLFGAIVFELTREDILTLEMKEEFKEKFSKLFNMAIFPFYWEGYEYIPGHPTWQNFNEVLDWCHSQGILCKGHPLAWTHVAGTPPWIYNISPDNATALLQARIIENIMGFKGKIDMWDVVNEAANTVDWKTALQDSSRKNDNRYPFYKKPVNEIADWVEPCYHWAYAGNPEANLILNDFGQIAFSYTRQRFFDLVKELQKRGTPLSGIGLQAHEPRPEWFDPNDVWETLNWYGELNLPIHITEFHPLSTPVKIEGDYKKGLWSPENQAEYAEMMYTLAFGHPNVVSFNWWDVTENDSFIKGSALLEKDLSPKPVYKKLDYLINEKWNTNIEEKTNKEGVVEARGFYGDYKVSVTLPGGEVQQFNYSHLKDRISNWDIQIN